MKILLLVILITLEAAWIGKASAQTITEDAIKITNSFSPNASPDEIKMGFQILTRYMDFDAATVSIQEIPNRLKDTNPYLEDVVKGVKIRLEERSNQAIRDIESKFAVPQEKLDLQKALMKALSENDSELNALKGQKEEVIRKMDSGIPPRLDSAAESKFKQSVDRLQQQSEVLQSDLQNVRQEIEQILNSQSQNLKQLKEKLNKEQIIEINKYFDFYANSVLVQPDFVQTSTQQINISVEGLSESTLIDGTATFIANRIKQEAKAFFFERFKSTMLDTNNNVGILFPTTVKLWNAFDNYDYSSYLNMFRASFRKDLNNMVFNLPVYFERNGNMNALNKAFMKILVDSYRSLGKGESPAGVLKNLSISEEIILENASFVVGKKYLSIFSDALSESQTLERSWITRNRFNEVFQNETTRKIFLGLIYQRILKENHSLRTRFAKSPQAEELLGQLLSNETRFKSASNLFDPIRGLFNICLNLDETHHYLILKKNSGMMINKEDILPIYVSTINLIKYAARNFGVEYVRSNSDAIDELLNGIYELFEASVKEDYASLIFGVYQLIAANSSEKDNVDIALLLKYGSFMAELSAAKSGEDVSKAIDAAALPVGSYGIKKRNKLNVSINSFPGIIVGYEWPGDTLSSSSNIGFTAPVGLAISWPITTKDTSPKSKSKRYNENRVYSGRSLSAFVTIFDLAAPVLYRLKSTSDGFPQEVKISQFVSPGISMVYGFKNSPFSILVGIQLTPDLRQFGTIQESVARANLAFTFDIPIFNLYTNTD